MVCRGICEGFRIAFSQRSLGYIPGRKYCSNCEVWIETFDIVFCGCCGQHLRTGQRSPKTYREVY